MSLSSEAPSVLSYCPESCKKMKGREERREGTVGGCVGSDVTMLGLQIKTPEALAPQTQDADALSTTWVVFFFSLRKIKFQKYLH